MGRMASKETGLRSQEPLGVTLVLLCLALIPGLSRAKAEASNALGFRDFLERSNDGSASRMEQAELESQIARESESGLLPDPIITLGRDRIALSKHGDSAEDMESSRETPETPASWVISLSQPLTWPGQRDAERRLASAETRLGKARRTANQIWNVFTRARDYLDIVVLDQRIALRREGIREISELVELMAIRRSRAMSSHRSALRLATELEIAQQGIAALIAEHEALRSRAQVSVGLPALPLLSFDRVLPAGELFKKTQVSEPKPQVLGQPELLDRLASDVVLAHFELRRSRLRPSLMVGLNLMFEDNQNKESFASAPMLGVMASMSLPLWGLPAWSALDEGIAAESRRARASNDGARAQIDLALHEASLRLKRAEDIVRTIENRLLPLNEEHLQILARDFANGQASALDINEERRAVLALREAGVLAQAALVRERWVRELLTHSPDLAPVTLDLPMPRLSWSGATEMMSGGMDEGGATGPMKPMGPRDQKDRIPKGTPLNAPKGEPSGGLEEEQDSSRGESGAGSGGMQM